MTTSGDPRLLLDETARRTDQKFFEQSRKLSPKFPDRMDALERKRRHRENVTARILLTLAAVFGLSAPFAEHPAGMASAAGACIVGFVVICFVAGARAHERSEAGRGNPL